MRQPMERAAESLLIRNYERYYRLAYAYVKTEEDALDVVQESAYKVMSNCRKVKQAEYLETWIYRIVLNTAKDMLRKRMPVLPLDPEAENRRAGYEDTYADLDLEEALDRLEESEKTIVLLRFFEDRTLDEIARTTDMNVSTVKSRLYRALKKLKVALEV